MSKNFSGLFLSFLLVVSSTFLPAFAAELPPQVTALLQQWRTGGRSQALVEALNDLVDRNDAAVRTLFRQELEKIARGGGEKTGDFVSEVLGAISDYEMKLSTELAVEVAARHNVDAVLRTGSSGDRHMNWKGKAADNGRFVVGSSDDDISFFGKEGEKAAEEFNRLKASRKLGKSRCGGFPMHPISDTTSYDLLVKQIENPNAFAGAAGYGGIKKEILEKGGAVIAVREGSSMVETAERVADYVARNKTGSLAEIMDVATIARELEEFGPLTMYASCARQLSHNPSDQETVKYLVRIYAGSAASKSFEEAVLLNCRHKPGYFKIVGEKLMKAYNDKTGKAAAELLSQYGVSKLQSDVWEAVMLSTSHKLGEMVKKAEQEMGEGAVNIARHPELRRMIHEIAAGFALLEKLPRGGAAGDVFLNVIPDILVNLKLKDPQRQTLYKVLYTAFVDARSLNEAAADTIASGIIRDWIAAGSPPGLTARLKEAGVDGVDVRRLLLEMAEERMAGKKACESVKNLRMLVATPKGDSFLWRMLASETGQKFVVEAIAMAPFALLTMYSEYQRGEMKDLSDAAFTLIDFVPEGMAIKKGLCEGMNNEVVFLFVKDGLYFTPAWPLVLAGDVIHMSWLVSSGIRLQNENEGLVDLLVYNGDYDEKDGKYTFKNLNLPDGATVSRDGLRDWLFTTKYVRVRHSLDGLEYRINDLSEKAWHLFNGFYVPNDPALQQMRLAIEQQLSGINWDEAGKYFTAEGNAGMAAAGYLLWLAGVEYIKTSGRNENWARLYEKLKADFEKLKDVLQKDVMVPQLIALAEEKRAALNAENELRPKLIELQKKLEALRGGNSEEDKKLGVKLVDEVEKLAKQLANKDDSVIFGATKSGSEKKVSRGEYWQAAYAAYLRIYEMSRQIPVNVKRITGYDRTWVLRFKWTGNYVDDLRRAEQSHKGFARDIFKSRGDIQKIKGSLPDLADSIDAQAFDILASVLFPWRHALDESGSEEPGDGSPFFKEYDEAIEKVKALYAKNKDFASQLQKGSRLVVEPEPVAMGGGASDVELQLIDPDLVKLLEEKNLIINWSVKPHGEIVGPKNAFRTRLALGRPEPAVLMAEVERLGRERAKGSVRRLVMVVVPDNFITLTMDPKNPVVGGAFDLEADVPARFYGKDMARFEFRWSGGNCIVSGGNSSKIRGKAGLQAGPGWVEVELWVNSELGESVCIGRKRLEFNVVDDGSVQLLVKGGLVFQEGDPLLFESLLRGIDEKAVADLEFSWVENGRVIGRGRQLDAGKRQPGRYEIEAQVSYVNAAKKKVKLVQKHVFTVEPKKDKPKPSDENEEDDKGKKTGKSGESKTAGQTGPSVSGTNDGGTAGDRSGPGSGSSVNAGGQGQFGWVLVESKEWSQANKSRYKIQDVPTCSAAKNSYTDGFTTRDIGGGSISSSGKTTWNTPPSAVGPAGSITFNFTAQISANMSPCKDYNRTSFMCIFTHPFVAVRLEATTTYISESGYITSSQKEEFKEDVGAGVDFKSRMPPSRRGEPPPSDSASASKSGSVTWTFPDMKGYSRRVEVKLNVFSHGYGGAGGCAYTYRYCGGVSITNLPPTNAVSEEATNAALQVVLTAEPPAIAQGETSTVSARVTGGTPPYHYAWKGEDEAGKFEGSVAVIGKEPGKRTVSVTVLDSKNVAATQSVIVNVGEIKATVRLTDPKSDKICIGKTGSFAAEVTASGRPLSGQYRFQWQPHPEVSFDPFESETKRETIATFNRLGRVGVWVEVLAKKGPVWAKLAESEQVAVEVVKPEFKLEFVPAEQYVGEEVAARLVCKPEIPVKELDIRWLPPPANAKQLASQKAEEMKFYAADNKPVKVEAIVLASTSRDDLGRAEGSFSAKLYEVKVSPPKRQGPVPRVWKEGTGLVEVPDAIAVFQDVFVSAEIVPRPSKDLRWKWSATPDGCSILSPASRETRLNAAEKGSYEVAVEVSNSDGVVLGRGTATLSVTVGADDMKGGDRSKDAADKLAKAKQAVGEGKLDEGLGLAKEAAGLDPKNAEAGQLVARWERERGEVLAHIQRFGQALAASKPAAAAESLQNARQLHPRYQPVVEAAARLKEFNDRLKASEDEAQRLIGEGYALEKKDDLAGAIAKYRQALALVKEEKLEKHIAELEAKLEQRARAQTLINEGYTFEKQDKLKEAIDCYEAALKLTVDEKLKAHIFELKLRLGSAKSGSSGVRTLDWSTPTEKKGPATDKKPPADTSSPRKPSTGTTGRTAGTTGRTVEPAGKPGNSQRGGNQQQTVPPRREPTVPVRAERSVSGTYVCSMSEGGMSVTMRLELVQNGTAISGSMSISPAPPEASGGRLTGSISGNVMLLKAVASPDADPMRFTVAPDGQALTMTVSDDGETHAMVFRKSN